MTVARAAPAHGTWQDGQVLVLDPVEATRLHSRSGLGSPQPGNQLRLDLVEAAYATAAGWLEVTGTDGPLQLAQILLSGAERGDRTEVHYLAYSDLRDRGLIIRPAGDGTYHVWARGGSLRDPPWITVRPLPERSPVTAADLLAWAVGREILAIVDEDGCITHYQLQEAHPQGTLPLSELPACPATLLQDRVLVEGSAAAAIHGQEAIGTPHGDGLILSLTEAEALRRRGVLQVPALAEHATARQPHFPTTLPVYEALRSAGVVARSGFKFGTHLRGYAGRPDGGHAEWLFQCHRADAGLSWSALSRAIRLAHGVRKHFLVAVPGPRVQYVELAWFRP